jgi:ABC-type multidrug transport system fused ATPase/permease subunit
MSTSEVDAKTAAINSSTNKVQPAQENEAENTAGEVTSALFGETKPDAKLDAAVDDLQKVMKEADGLDKSTFTKLNEKKDEKPQRTQEQKAESNKFIMSLLANEKCRIFFGIVFLLGGEVGNLAIPMFIGAVINLLQEDKYEEIETLCLILIGLVLFSAICIFFRGNIFNIMSEQIAKNLRGTFYEKMLKKDISFYDDRKTGDLVSRLNSDIQVIQDSLSTNISMFVRSVLFIVACLIILIIISPILMGTTCAGVVVVLVFAFFYAGRMRQLQKDIQGSKAQMTTVAEESWSNVRTVKAFSNEQQEVDKFEVDNKLVFSLGKKKAMLQAIFGFTI